MDRITDRPDMTSAVDRGRKASTKTKTNKEKIKLDTACDTIILLKILSSDVHTLK